MKGPLRLRFDALLERVESSKGDLEFVLDNLGNPTSLNYTRNSIALCQDVLLELTKRSRDPIDSEWCDHLIELLPYYLGESIINNTPAFWAIEEQKSSVWYGNPKVTGFGDMDWESYYPHVLRQILLDKPSRLLLEFNKSLEVWKLAQTLTSGILNFFATSPGQHSVDEIMGHLVLGQTIPDPKFGVARFKQFKERVNFLLRRNKSFRKVPKLKDTYMVASETA